jgi:hypothetical protein
MMIPMAPRFWTVTVEGHTVTAVAGTREAAEKIAARRMARGTPGVNRGRTGGLTDLRTARAGR